MWQGGGNWVASGAGVAPGAAPVASGRAARGGGAVSGVALAALFWSDLPQPVSISAAKAQVSNRAGSRRLFGDVTRT